MSTAQNMHITLLLAMMRLQMHGTCRVRGLAPPTAHAGSARPYPAAPHRLPRRSDRARAAPARGRLELVVASATETAASAVPESKKRDLIKGCRIILQELKGLDFSRTEARMYFKLTAKLPKGTLKGFDFDRARACLEQLLDGEAEGYNGPMDALDDVDALQVTQDTLSEIWRWRRRGGGMNDEDDSPPHQHALQDIQRVEKEDIDRVTSSLLDTLPLSDKQKTEMAGAVEQATLAGINGAVWGSMVGAAVLLLGLNFLRG